MCCSPPAAPAAICSPPRRSPPRWRSAASRSISPPTTARSNTAAIFPPARSTPFPRRRRRARAAFPGFAAGLRVLVTGGSQGARVMSEVIPAALARLDAAERARLTLVLQARGEDRARAEADCARLGFAAEIAEFFPDLPARI